MAPLASSDDVRAAWTLYKSCLPSELQIARHASITLRHILLWTRPQAVGGDCLSDWYDCWTLPRSLPSSILFATWSRYTMPPRPVRVEHSPRRYREEPRARPDRARSVSREPPRRRASSTHRNRAPPSPGSDDSANRRVHWPDDPADHRNQPRGRPAERPPRQPSRSRTRSMTQSPSRSRDVEYIQHRASLPDDQADKPWFKKKTVWTTVASLATVAALVPSAMSATASIDAAHSASRAARNTKRAAAAGEQSARASMLSARAVNNTTIAQGHQDRYGRYTGPARHAHAGSRGIGHHSGSRREIMW